MACVGRGVQGDVGQRIRDEMLMIQVYQINVLHKWIVHHSCKTNYPTCHQRNNDCKSGIMEEWHLKLHNNSGPDNVINCEVCNQLSKHCYQVK